MSDQYDAHEAKLRDELFALVLKTNGMVLSSVHVRELLTPVLDALLLTFVRARAKRDALASGEQSKFPAEGNWMCLTDDWSCDRREALEEAQRDLAALMKETT